MNEQENPSLLIDLIKSAINDIETGERKLSSIIRTCVRIARIRKDYINLIWLQQEIVDFSNPNERSRAMTECVSNLDEATFKYYYNKFGEMWMMERPAIEFDNYSIKKSDKIRIEPVPEIELEIEKLNRIIIGINTPVGLSPIDLYAVDKRNTDLRLFAETNIKHFSKILEGIKNRVYDYLCQVEQQILFGEFFHDFFNKNRTLVEKELSIICPEGILEFLNTVNDYQINPKNNKPQVLLACRRLLKAVADVLYSPPQNEDLNNKNNEHNLSDEKFLNRLIQFVKESNASGSTKELLDASLTDFINRVEKIYGLSCKGIHNDVSEFEVNQCLIQTYVLISDLIKIQKEKIN